MLVAAALCLWAIPIFVPETFGVSGVWDEPSDYWFASVAVAAIGSVVAGVVIQSESTLATVLRGVVVTLGILIATLGAATIVYVGMITFAIGL